MSIAVIGVAELPFCAAITKIVLFAGTALEASLPVQIELPQNMQKPPVAVMLVLETTESPDGDQVVRGAANAVIDQLSPRDFVGVTNGTGVSLSGRF